MRTTRERLSVRLGAAPLPTLVEGVPASLEPALRDWIRDTANVDARELLHVLIRLDLVLPDFYRKQYQSQLKAREVKQAQLTAAWEAEQAAKPKDDSIAVGLERRQPYVPLPQDPHVLFLAYGTNIEILWDVVDDLLHVFCSEPLPSELHPVVAWVKGGPTKRTARIVEPLELLLAESRSVYEVAPDRRGLQRRMEASLGDALEAASTAADGAGYPAAQRHLARCRDKLFALHPDPSSAYVEAILAVEAVASPMFLPKLNLPTLGRVRDHLRQADRKYEYVLTDKSGTPGSTAGVVAMMSDLWEGHSDRHAGGPLSVPVTQESAEAALTIATSLVTLLSKRAVRLRPAPPLQP